MDFIGLINRAKSECGIAGNPITALTGNSNEMIRLAGWVSTAWQDVQTERQDWRFMRKPFTVNTVADVQSYSPASASISDYSKWKDDSFRIYRTADGVDNEQFLTHWEDYSEFRDYYLFSSLRSQRSTPTDIVIDPDDNLLLGFTPDDVYTVVGEYYRKPQELTLATDTPIIPSEFHMIIVYETMISYGYFNVASEQLSRGREKLAKLKSRLLQKYSPIIGIGDSFI